jgi:hypothetical protein
MKKVLLALSGLIIAIFGNSQVKRLMDSEIKFDKGLFYYNNIPFTGIGITRWNEKQIKSENFKNGKIDGIETIS